MHLLLLIAAIIIGIAGVVSIFRGNILLGILLIVIACVVGPGGYSLYKGP